MKTGATIRADGVAFLAPPLGLAPVNSFSLILAKKDRPIMASRINRIPLGRFPYFEVLS